MTMAIEVDEEVKKYIVDAKHDYRVCTACFGPALVSTEVKSPKDTDTKIPVGDYILYISKVQVPYIEKITMGMVYDEGEIDSCPAFYGYSAKNVINGKQKFLKKF